MAPAPEPATAFVPGHVTGFFTVHRGEDPLHTGSRGAGLALSEGVEVRVRPAGGAGEVRLNGSPSEVAPVGRVLDALRVRAAVDLDTELPVGAGFGVSGAAALGTALAAAAVFDLTLSENELVRVAHGAEVEAGTGLGDVVAQARGGVPVRLEPGAPPHGTLDGLPARPRVEFVSFGGVATADVIEGDTDAVSAAGREALSRLVEAPSTGRFMEVSRRFARESGLLTDWVREAVTAVAEAGGDASMAMLGDTAFALGTGLSDAGYDPVVCHTHPGATPVTDDADE